MNSQNDVQGTVTQEPKKHKKLKRALIIIGAVLLCFIITFVSAFAVMYNVGKKQLFAQNTSSNVSDYEEFDDSVIEHNGVNYKYNDNITCILFMGVDEKSIDRESDRYGTNGQADAVYLMAIDTATGKTDVIGISRDSMTDVSVYSKQGNYIGTEKMQLCLAYSYGDRRHTSCQNVVQSVSRMFYSIPINTYFAIDLSGIGPLVNAVGGFNVNQYDMQGNVIAKKYITSSNALSFVRQRDQSLLDSNLARMANQQEFIKGFASKATEQTKKDIKTPVRLFNVVSGYAVTNINASRITYLTSVYLKGGATINFHNVKGEVKKGKYAEYHIDQEALYQQVLDIFYKKQ